MPAQTFGPVFCFIYGLHVISKQISLLVHSGAGNIYICKYCSLPGVRLFPIDHRLVPGIPEHFTHYASQLGVEPVDSTLFQQMVSWGRAHQQTPAFIFWFGFGGKSDFNGDGGGVV